MRLDEGRTLNPGLLREQVTFQRKTVTGQNSYGEDTYTWTDVLTCKMQVVAMQGRELESAQQRWAEARFRLRGHYTDRVTTTMRAVWNGRYLDVLDAEDPYGTRRVLQVAAKESK